LPPPTDNAGEDRQKDHRNDNQLDVLGDARDFGAEEVSEHEHAPDPRRPPEYAERQKSSVIHLADPGHEWRECPDDRHESREHDGFRPVFDIKLVRALDVLLLEEQGIFAREDARAGQPTDPVVGIVPKNGRTGLEEAQLEDIER
jgi:hypothetical protein